MPTIKQMKARMLSGHKLALEAVCDGRQLETNGDGELRGYRKVLVTLRNWGAVDDNGLIDIGANFSPADDRTGDQLQMSERNSNPLPPPDAQWHRADAEYARELFGRLDDAGISQRKTAQRLGVSDRILRAYAKGEQTMPYTVQYALEALANNPRGEEMNAVHEAATGAGRPNRIGTVWYDAAERPMQKGDSGKLIVGRDQFGQPIYGKVGRDHFGMVIEDASGLDVRNTPVDRVVQYTLLDPPPSE